MPFLLKSSVLHVLFLQLARGNKHLLLSLEHQGRVKNPTNQQKPQTKQQQQQQKPKQTKSEAALCWFDLAWQSCLAP